MVALILLPMLLSGSPWPDSVVLAGYVDAVVVVAKAGSTTRRSLGRCLEMLRLADAPIAGVVLNRVRSPAFPKTVCGVVFQGAARGQTCQFSFACDGSLRRGRELIAWNRAQHVAARALSGAVMAAVGNATHFHTTAVRPGWGPNLLRVAQVGLHVFYRFGHGAPTAFAAGDGPEMTAHPLYADDASDIRLASAVVTAAPADAPAGLRGAIDVQPSLAAAEATAKSVEAPKPAKLTPTSQPTPVKVASATAS